MERLLHISDSENIPPIYKGTPISKLLDYHNLGLKHGVYTDPQMLIATCMDFRLNFIIPKNFAYMIRTGGANMKNMEFKISFAISVGGIKHIAIIAHTDCGMTKLSISQKSFVLGMVKSAKWSEGLAIRHFKSKSLEFGIKDEIDFTLKESKRLKKLYPGITIVPMLYDVVGGKISLINDGA